MESNKNKISKTYDIVKGLLSQERFRDDDELLVVRIWHDELEAQDIKPKEITGYELLTHIKDRKVTPADTITRARRKVQEECSFLRGKNYVKRKHKTQKEVIDDLARL